MPNLLIPTALRAFADGKSETELAGNTAGELIAAFANRYPDIRTHLYNENGTLRSFINIYVGETNIKNLSDLDTPLTADSIVMLVPAIAGGARVAGVQPARADYTRRTTWRKNRF
ncbi:MAG: MoaD/ThiS family protein [Clostridiales Family XIII bacterium]|jgi:molybdopterin converting factor small subunit|nr:MoaD/ThiS family protein [Clostridiales Family XIII bacterium]